jgi:dephospho-CoA kinase
MSGTGKSTLVQELSKQGYTTVDADEPRWSELRQTSPELPDREWLWREDAIERLLSNEYADVLFVSGCASNQVKFYPQFDHIVLLSAPPEVLLERLSTRTTNSYGKRPDEFEEVLENQRTVEPLLRKVATLELDTRAPIEETVTAIVSLLASADLR